MAAFTRMCVCLCAFVLLLNRKDASVMSIEMSTNEKIEEMMFSMNRTVERIEQVINVIKHDSAYDQKHNELLIRTLESVNFEIRSRFGEQELNMIRNQPTRVEHPDLYALEFLNQYKSRFYDYLLRSVEDMTDLPNADDQKQSTIQFLNKTLILGEDCLFKIKDEVDGHRTEWNMVISIFDNTFLDEDNRNNVDFLAARRRMDTILESCQQRFDQNVADLERIAVAYCKKIEADNEAIDEEALELLDRSAT